MRYVPVFSLLSMLNGCGANPTPPASSESPASVGSEGKRASSQEPVYAPDTSNIFCAAEQHAEPQEFERVGKINERLPDAIRQPSDIQATIRARFKNFKACYEKALALDPRVHGTVSTRFAIAPDGSTRAACIASSSLPEVEVLSCLLLEYSKLKFSRADTQVTVVYPLQFEPK